MELFRGEYLGSREKEAINGTDTYQPADILKFQFYAQTRT